MYLMYMMQNPYNNSSTIKGVILTKSDVDQYLQGQSGSHRQLRLEHPDYLGRLERDFWGKFMKFKLFLPLT